MRIRPGIILTIIAVFGVLIAGRYLGWFGGKSNDVAVNTAPAEPPPEAVEPPVSRPNSRMNTPKPPVTAATATTTPAPPVETGVITDWEQRIDDVLTGQDEEAAKARRLLEIFPRLPEDGQVEAAQHISNLLPDEQFAEIAKLLADPKTPEGVLDVLMTDVLNRPNKLKLDSLFDVARTPNHPKAEEARDVLEVFLDDVDWDAVKASGNWDPVKAEKDKWLKENPDQE
jgi:hypothetical protein